MNPNKVRSHVEIDHVVGPSDTAQRWGGDLPVLATPVLVWLSEVAAVESLEAALDEDEASVSVRHDARQLTTVVEGSAVVVRVTSVGASPRVAVFDIEASDHNGIMFRSMHVREIVKVHGSDDVCHGYRGLFGVR
ncbi:hypothetical protein OOZ19_22570 [Saccharopolyspora sp. NFXS83]|uniref:thioesterase family protein n=1 Tax=Saccharopolyspora sp. NFXS83 TaxID=2993560 RepID=UPI00224B3BF6|nr:hypothetical protein [Saccharopolyspora sp. NFXS83]MCX2733034.1 hypothetical protein [Saccharopolyspora sp. NFXS83]